MNARMERKSASHDITFCVSECKNKCMRHISNYTFKEDELVSMSDFNCENEDIKEQFEAIQYFRENLDWFHSLEIDTDKLKTVLNLAEKGINLEKENRDLREKLFEKNSNDVKEKLERYFAYLDSDYVPKWKIECLITGIQKEYKKGKYNEYQKRIFISMEELLKSLFKEGQHDSISD